MKIFISEKEKDFNDAKTVFEDLTVFDPTKGFKHFEVQTIEQHDRELLQEFSSKIVKILSSKYSVAHSELLLQISFDIANLLEGGDV